MNPRTVVVVNSGAPVEMPWRDDVAAVLLSWFPGQEFGGALADVLTGAREPGGRLPTTWPVTMADVPVLDTTPDSGGTLTYAEGVHIGYRAWLRSGVEPAYPFGHGLGYTTWELSDLEVSGRTATVTVRNTGDRSGKYVVQAYLSRPHSTLDRPVRWLAAFDAVTLDAGGSRRVEIELPRRAFEHWTERGWGVGAGLVHSARRRFGDRSPADQRDRLRPWDPDHTFAVNQLSSDVEFGQSGVTTIVTPLARLYFSVISGSSKGLPNASRSHHRRTQRHW
ncbi:glycoside hydrolase family 3 C-terminal domain-containing protein [Nocardia miyunensis]|uniref:glycoside hydrolase family 3 C-terminal domain-containing protein n=1 Tax=Nocardia miyunensis TaxID=282684 RepID=UPI000834967F|nr:glycoside hydrolase family 3 C-terminal domain-containing protein [Nocardia miyunensis]